MRNSAGSETKVDSSQVPPQVSLWRAQHKLREFYHLCLESNSLGLSLRPSPFSLPGQPVFEKDWGQYLFTLLSNYHRADRNPQYFAILLMIQRAIFGSLVDCYWGTLSCRKSTTTWTWLTWWCACCHSHKLTDEKYLGLGFRLASGKSDYDLWMFAAWMPLSADSCAESDHWIVSDMCCSFGGQKVLCGCPAKPQKLPHLGHMCSHASALHTTQWQQWPSLRGYSESPAQLSCAYSSCSLSQTSQVRDCDLIWSHTYRGTGCVAGVKIASSVKI